MVDGGDLSSGNIEVVRVEDVECSCFQGICTIRDSGELEIRVCFEGKYCGGGRLSDAPKSCSDDGGTTGEDIRMSGPEPVTELPTGNWILES